MPGFTHVSFFPYGRSHNRLEQGEIPLRTRLHEESAYKNIESLVQDL